MDDLRLIAGVVAIAVVCAVWCIGPNVGDALTKGKTPTKGEQGSKK